MIRAVRKALLISVAQAWLVVLIVAWTRPGLVIPAIALAVLYAGSMPLVIRSVERDAKRRTVESSGANEAAARSFGGN